MLDILIVILGFSFLGFNKKPIEIKVGTRVKVPSQWTGTVYTIRNGTPMTPHYRYWIVLDGKPPELGNGICICPLRDITPLRDQKIPAHHKALIKKVEGEKK